MPSAPKSLSIRKIQRLYATGKLSPVEVTQGCLTQIEKLNPLLNAFCHYDAASALKAARASLRRWKAGKPLGPLDGIPVSIKDWFDVTGMPTRQGSRTTDDAPKAQDSLPVAKLRAKGAIIIGKTTLPEFGHKGVCHSPLHGITRNPWNPEKTSGGSSGGAAVAAATGMALLNLGSDAGGSIRMPASFCGVFGFKPSPGVLSSGMPSIFSSLSSIGPLTNCVDDAAFMLDALSGDNPHDFTSLPLEPMAFVKHIDTKLPKLRILCVDTINGQTLTADAKAVWNKNKSVLKKLGHIEERTLELPRLTDVFTDHWTALASLMATHIPKKDHKKFDKRFAHWVARGDKQHLHTYLCAEHLRLVIGGILKNILENYDLIATPSTAFPAFDVGIDMPTMKNGKPWEDWNFFSAFANLGRLPAASLPLGLTQDGLPIGLQLCGAYLDDLRVMQAAKKLEAEIGFKSYLSY